MRRIALAVATAVAPAVCSANDDPNDHASAATSTTTTTVVEAAFTLPTSHDVFDGSHIEFDRPKTWRAQSFPDEQLARAEPFVYLSPEELSPRCDPSGAQSCADWPLDRLQPSDVLIAWTGPVAGGDAEPNARIGSLPVELTVARPGDCRAIGADETITAKFLRDKLGLYTMHACLRGPGVQTLEQNVYAMLASVKLA